MSKQTHVDRVLLHMQQHGKIDTWTAYRLYGHTRLSDSIWRLRHKMGIPVTDKYVTKKNRFGVKTSFKVYSLEQ